VDPLFNVENLDAGIQLVQSQIRRRGNEIVGTSVTNTPNSFLCTAKDYGDFILEFDFKVDPRLNSGVQFRSECFDEQALVCKARPSTSPLPRARLPGGN